MIDFKNINKLFIISSGRTGTDFLGKNIGYLSNSIYSIHQPDVINFTKSRRKELFFKLTNLGFINIIVLKFLGIKGTRNLSLKRVKNYFEKEKSLKKLIDERKKLNLNPVNLYIEANWQLFGIIQDLLSLKSSKVILIFRDPRNWVTSWMNKGGWYDNKDLLSKINVLGFKRITPQNVGIYNPEWKNYTRFQKLCWVWNYMNSNFYNTLRENNKNVRHFFFEDIFMKKDKTTIRNFLQFALDDYFKEEYVNKMLGMLQNKVNENTQEEFPKWPDWDKKYCRDLHYFCGDLMQKLGYGNEPEWLEKLT